VTERSARLPFPPSINGAFAQSAFFNPARKRMELRRHQSKAYRAWQEEAVLRLQALKWPRYEGIVGLWISLFPPFGLPRDLDNYNKAPIDALWKSRVLRGDDWDCIRELHEKWHDPVPRKDAYIALSIRPLPHERPFLTLPEHSTLARIRKAGVLLVAPDHELTATQRSLIVKGYIEPQPGLLPGQPQGYVAV
jgi:Holliday junction resolvase RusA-like endonuclease